jgi:multidrug efflux system membrane fusion protein
VQVRPSTKLLMMLSAVFIAAVAGWLVWSYGHKTANAATQPGGGGAAAAGAAPVPVLATEAKTQDVPIVVRGVGTVTAFNTVTVKSRVDGNITQVAYTEGQYVHAGDLLIQIDPRPYQAQLDQAAANQAKDQANLDNARLNLARDAAIVKSNLAVSQQQYDNEKATVAQDAAAVESDKAQVETARLNLDYTAIRSPIDGVTGLRPVDIGNLVQAASGTTLVTLTQITPIAVIFSVAEVDLTRIREAMKKQKLPVLAFDGEDKKELAQGELLLINNQVDQATGMVTLKSIFPNQDAALWPGEFVNAHLVTNTVKNGVTVPAAAVQMGPTGAFVYRIKPDTTVETAPVTVTQVEAGMALLGKGLAPGDKVVISGQSGLSPGVKVAVEQGTLGEMTAKEPEIGPEGVGSTGVNTAPSGAGELTPR